MRIVVNEYGRGGRFAYETNEDGSLYIKTLAGSQQVGQRIGAYIEVFSDDTEQGIDRLLESLAWLSDEIKKRKSQPVGV